MNHGPQPILCSEKNGASSFNSQLRRSNESEFCFLLSAFCLLELFRPLFSHSSLSARVLTVKGFEGHILLQALLWKLLLDADAAATNTQR
jgi:hypothetical protein